MYSNILNSNISGFERNVRVLLGAALVLSVISWGTVPWLALAGAYLVLTSIPAWDPVYALIPTDLGRQSRSRHGYSRRTVDARQ